MSTQSVHAKLLNELDRMADLPQLAFWKSTLRQAEMLIVHQEARINSLEKMNETLQQGNHGTEVDYDGS